MPMAPTWARNPRGSAVIAGFSHGPRPAGQPRSSQPVTMPPGRARPASDRAGRLIACTGRRVEGVDRVAAHAGHVGRRRLLEQAHAVVAQHGEHAAAVGRARLAGRRARRRRAGRPGGSGGCATPAPGRPARSCAGPAGRLGQLRRGSRSPPGRGRGRRAARRRGGRASAPSSAASCARRAARRRRATACRVTSVSLTADQRTRRCRTMPAGRFAPSPTADLHLGNLRTALRGVVVRPRRRVAVRAAPRGSRSGRGPIAAVAHAPARRPRRARPRLGRRRSCGSTITATGTTPPSPRSRRPGSPTRASAPAARSSRPRWRPTGPAARRAPTRARVAT